MMADADIIRLLVEIAVIVAAVAGFGLRVGQKIEALRTEIALGRQEFTTQASSLASARAELERLANETRERGQHVWQEIGALKAKLAVLEDRQSREAMQ